MQADDRSENVLCVFFVRLVLPPSLFAGFVDHIRLARGLSDDTIRAALERVCQGAGVGFVAPPLALCTDNAAMIAWAGIERLRIGLVDGLDLVARPRWPLDLSQPALVGSGKKGAKA